jgi:hypothetical protein
MNRRQRDKALAELAIRLATQNAAKATASAQGNEAHFYAMCAAIDATELEIRNLQRPSGQVDRTTAALISANVD